MSSRRKPTKTRSIRSISEDDSPSDPTHHDAPQSSKPKIPLDSGVNAKLSEKTAKAVKEVSINFADFIQSIEDDETAKMIVEECYPQIQEALGTYDVPPEPRNAHEVTIIFAHQILKTIHDFKRDKIGIGRLKKLIKRHSETRQKNSAKKDFGAPLSTKPKPKPPAAPEKPKQVKARKSRPRDPEPDPEPPSPSPPKKSKKKTLEAPQEDPLKPLAQPQKTSKKIGSKSSKKKIAKTIERIPEDPYGENQSDAENLEEDFVKPAAPEKVHKADFDYKKEKDFAAKYEDKMDNEFGDYLDVESAPTTKKVSAKKTQEQEALPEFQAAELDDGDADSYDREYQEYLRSLEEKKNVPDTTPNPFTIPHRSSISSNQQEPNSGGLNQNSSSKKLKGKMVAKKFEFGASKANENIFSSSQGESRKPTLISEQQGQDMFSQFDFGGGLAGKNSTSALAVPIEKLAGRSKNSESDV